MTAIELTMICGFCLLSIWASGKLGYARGRADAFAEVQRWHLEDEEALKQASERGSEARQAQA